MPGVVFRRPQTPREWRQWGASMVFATALFGVVILFRDRSWIRGFMIGVFVVLGLSALVMTGLQVRRAHRQAAEAPPDPEEEELCALDEQLDRLKQAEPELRALVARRNAGSISEEEFARRRDELLGGSGAVE